MAKLVPPIVDSTIPAFYSSNHGTVNITVPFSMNRAVNKNLIKGIAVKIKTLQNSFALLINYDGIFNLDGNPYVNITVDSSYFIQGQFYKFQIAYIDLNDDIGYYSNVTVGKYTSQPIVNIKGLKQNKSNNHIYNYYGYYQNNDVTENVYSYRFDLYDKNNQIIVSTGDLIHDNGSDDNLGESTDLFILSRDLGNEIYYLQYTIMTTNNLILQTDKYLLRQSLSIDSDIDQPILEAIIDDNEKQNGLVRISLISKKAKQINGNFILYRASSDTDFLDWEECYRFSLQTNSIINKKNLWEDKTVQCGKEYKYAIAQYNEAGLQSEKIITEKTVKINFEDSFLCDAHKQLRIRFNPKVSSFKNVNLETKIETIGNKHPFILRNGRVSYKEFTISGLISYLMDMDNTFTNNNYNTLKQYNRNNTKEIIKNNISFDLSTDSTFNNIIKERDFKMEVLNWLTNGEPKLFRSPTEGNFLVRLMNVSLTPLENLGRMLHTFNCTAYEIAECNYQNLKNLGIIQLNSLNQNQSLCWKTIRLNDYSSQLQKNKIINSNLIDYPVQSINFYDMIPGSQILINFEDGNNQIIEIGSTGQYIVESENISISGIYLLNSKSYNGFFTYGFYQNIPNDFNTYSNVEIFEIPLHQFIGKNDIIKEILYINNGKDRNIKLDIVSIPRIKVTKRPVEEIRKDGDIYYRYNGYSEEQILNFDYSTLYCIYEYQYDENHNKKLQKMGYNSFKQIFDENTNSLKWIKVNEIDENNIDFSITLGSSKIEVKDTYDFFNEPKNLDFFSIIEKYDNDGNPIKNTELCIKSGNGVITEITYILKSSEYLIENQTIYNILNIRNEYEKEQNILDNMYRTGCIDENNAIERLKFMNNIIIQQEKIKNTYNNYINTLLIEQQRQNLVEGNVNDQQKQY